MLKVWISTWNDAFQPEPERELARLMRVCADKLERGHREIDLFDLNGNKVGMMELRHGTN